MQSTSSLGSKFIYTFSNDLRTSFKIRTSILLAKDQLYDFQKQNLQILFAHVTLFKITMLI